MGLRCMWRLTEQDPFEREKSYPYVMFGNIWFGHWSAGNIRIMTLIYPIVSPSIPREVTFISDEECV